MYLKQYFPLIIIALLAFSACKKSGSPGPGATTKTDADADVYVVGLGNLNDTIQAVIWKNGTPKRLSNDHLYSQARAIKVIGSDIYVAGIKLNNLKIETAAYWKNGAPIILSTNDSWTNAMAIYNNDVFIAGVDLSSTAGPVGGVYWKNNVEETFADNYFRPDAIAVNETGVYIAGAILGSAKDTLAYYSNGIITKLPGDVSPYSNISLALNGADVYVDGGDNVYWKNGVPTTLSGVSYTYSISVNNGDVYVAGNTTAANGNSIATYWKNGSPVNLTDGSSNALARVISFNGNDVYVLGVNGADIVYWKNGVAVKLQKFTNADEVSDMVVVPH